MALLAHRPRPPPRRSLDPASPTPLPRSSRMRARVTPESAPRCCRNARPRHSGIRAQVPPEPAPRWLRNTQSSSRERLSAVCPCPHPCRRSGCLIRLPAAVTGHRPADFNVGVALARRSLRRLISSQFPSFHRRWLRSRQVPVGRAAWLGSLDWLGTGAVLPGGASLPSREYLHRAECP